ncbi:MAG TPA: transglutaminase domain-containing protein [Bryobacteraceae bacterium]|nr:transglutaminase domain-containing protein [Bryobacteraceae bacterium]
MMTRRALLASTGCLIAQSRAGTRPETSRERTFNLEYQATVSDIPAGAAKLELWMPVAHNEAFQQIEALHVEADGPHATEAGAHGNQILHVARTLTAADRVPIALTFRATRRERIVQPIAHGSADVRLTAQERDSYLRPDRLVPLDDTIRKWAREVVDGADAKTDLEKARAIYNHIVATVKYDKTGKGWGRGDIYYACENRRGNCTDFHAIFIGYSRAVGVPARFSIGFPLPAQRGAGRIAGYHCWAEFFADGVGWVPVDASEAAKDPSRREYFFGALDENRVQFSRGRDLVLTPPQKGEPLNYFVFPYAEIDGQAHAAIETVVSYRDLA